MRWYKMIFNVFWHHTVLALDSREIWWILMENPTIIDKTTRAPRPGAHVWGSWNGSDTISQIGGRTIWIDWKLPRAFVIRCSLKISGIRYTYWIHSAVDNAAEDLTVVSLVIADYHCELHVLPTGVCVCGYIEINIHTYCPWGKEKKGHNNRNRCNYLNCNSELFIFPLF